MSIEFSQEEEDILRAVGYEEMKLDSSVIVSNVNGEWREVDIVTSCFVDRVCKLSKNTLIWAVVCLIVNSWRPSREQRRERDDEETTRGKFLYNERRRRIFAALQRRQR